MVAILALAAIAVLVGVLVFTLVLALRASGPDLERDRARSSSLLVSTTSVRRQCASDLRVIDRASPSKAQEHGP